jgi:hypothetical protein
VAAQSSSVCRIWDNSGFDGILRIATNLVDVPAKTIAVLDQQRWTIEIFFGFCKLVPGW